MHHRSLFALLIGALFLAVSPALAFPDRPVRIVVPYAPGGGNDALARVLAQKLEEQWGKPVVVENRSGGNTIIATEYVGRRPADGYTILMVTTVFAVNPSLLQKLPYDTLKNFAPVVIAGSAPNVLVTKPTLPVNSVKELIAYAHANTGKLTYGHPGIGTTPHLAVELFNSDANIKAVGVGYRGTQPQLVAILGGEIDYAFDVTSSLNHVQAGKLKGLAVTVSRRLERFPDMPTMIEAGLPGYEAYTWFGFVVPAGTPPRRRNHNQPGHEQRTTGSVRARTHGRSRHQSCGRIAARFRAAHRFRDGQMERGHPQDRDQTAGRNRRIGTP